MKCSVEIASVVTHLINYSINLGQIPNTRRTVIVIPVPKVSQAAGCSDCRPILVTLSCHVSLRELLLTDGYDLPYLQNFSLTSMLTGQLAVGLLL